MLVLLTDGGGSFTVSPNVEIVLWTLFVLLLVVAVIYAIVRLVTRGRRDG
jgi:flagellar biogenesis protein FliO